MAYRTLKSIFHQRDRAGADVEESSRRESPATISWDLRIGDHRMFALITPEVAALIERIMSYEPRIRHEWDGLPDRARDDYLDRMIVDEIQATNEIEQVRSTRKEINDALRALADERQTGSKRFIEMVRLYLDIGKPEARGPESLDDIRFVYDAVTAGEISDDDAPDGERFRKGSVSIESGTKVVHTGLVPESAIDQALTLMMSQGRDESVPLLVRAVVAHFIFEYTHPFYDGNGRTGRYLLALDLRQVLAPYASLALSATIADNKDRYYRAFAEAEDPLNRADLTMLVISILEIIAEAQHRLLIDLSDQRAKIDALGARIRDLLDDQFPERLGLDPDSDPSLRRTDIGALFFVLGQAWYFDANRAVKLQTLTRAAARSTQFVRRRIQSLVDAGVVETVTRKPLRFRLTEAGAELLELDRATS
ncbi:Fic family protein [Gordonia neofelifaecis]|uniref:Filamentation induced by cAMP protein Fic n=1 Tax=Gordonia neofelifaecis NRRL B-59395 TaxID=644548 RepID=F1YN06_9ACTN|nr:Fic family protein [Gordonia neofelifaecis]EGD53893.1 filamentation induced by cAMP protein Fic [Gordonia neofelifaecis NRRL B-59395]